MKKTDNSTAKRSTLYALGALLFILGLLGFDASASLAATGSFTFSSSAYVASESAGKVDITINRLNGSAGAATVKWQTNAVTAKSGKDYVGFGPTTLSFADGQTQMVKSIVLMKDTLTEADETFTITLTSPSTGTTLGAISKAVVTIKDGGDATAPAVAITSPVSGATYTSAQTVTIAASASDNVGVSKVEFYDGATLLGSDSAAPYSFAWAFTSANNGSHSFTAKAYDAAGNVSISPAVGLNVNIAVVAAEYVAPVLKPVTLSNGSYVLSWTLPATAYGTPDGGYDVFVDGVDDNLHHTTLSAVKSGLPLDQEHCFVVEARWTQAVPGVFPASNQVCVQSADTAAPAVSITSPASGATYTSAQTVTIAASASDNVGVSKVEFYDGATLLGSDSAAPYSFAWAFTSANNGSHSFTAKAYDAAGNVSISPAVGLNVNIAVVAAEYVAPVLKPVTLSNGSYVLSWTLPATAYGTPDGGYDVFVDGVDDNLHHTTLSAVKSGLDQNIDHCFVVEARWTQAVPGVFPASNQVCVLGADVTAPTASLTSPTGGATYTSAQTVTIAASASDNLSVSKVEFYAGTTLLGSDSVAPFSSAWPITSSNNGSHSLTAKAYDAAGNSKVSAAAAITVNIPVTDLTAPTVSLTSPATGATYTSAQTVVIAASATDNVGVSKVEFYSGSTLMGTDSVAPYSFSWAISSSNNGSHSFTAKAYDAAGNSKVSSATAVTVNIAPVVSGPLKVFPGAEGFGTETPAGRGGQIIKVTNLNDSGTGSLRAAIQAVGPRIVVFETSGTITLTSPININNPYLTVAGQTAPSPGITIKGSQLAIYSHDILIQHIRLRPGSISGDNMDGLSIRGPAHHVVIDHVSVSWATDENCGPYGTPGGISDITFSHSIVSESLQYGFLVGDLSTNVSLVGNLLAHNMDRNPLIKAGASAVILNNVMYNTSRYAFMSIGSNDSGRGPAYVSAVGNVFLNGPSTSTAISAVKIESTAPVGTQVYLADNVYSGTLFTRSSSFDPRVTTPPIWSSSLTVRSSSTVENWVLNSVGSRPADRDSVDDRVVNETKSRIGSLIGTEGQVGSWPNLPVNVRTFPVPANPSGDDDGDGYTNVEEVLHQMALAVEG